MSVAVSPRAARASFNPQTFRVASLTLTIAYNRLYDGVLTSFSHAFHAAVEVGDTVRVREDFEDTELVDAYVVDMSGRRDWPSARRLR